MAYIMSLKTEESDIDVLGNVSLLTVDIYIDKTSGTGAWSTYKTTFNVSYAGQIKSFSIPNYDFRNGSNTGTFHMGSVTFTVTHNVDGTYSDTLTATWAHDGNSFINNGKPITVSEIVELTTIPRNPDIPNIVSPTTYVMSELNTIISVVWNSTNRGTYTLEVSKNGGAYSSIMTDIDIETLSYEYHVIPVQGDIYNFRIKAVWNDLSSAYSYSGTVSVNELTPPTIGSLDVLNPFVASTYVVPLSGGSQSNGNDFTRRASIYLDGVKVYDSISSMAADNENVQIVVNPNDIVNVLGNTSYSTANRYSVVAWIENENGSTSTKTSKNFTVNINTDGGASPTLENPILSGGIGEYTATCFVSGISSLKVTSGTASPNRATTNTTLSYEITCDSVAQNSKEATFTNLSVGKKTITVTVTDSRGLSTTKTVYCIFQSWAKPTIKILKAERNESSPTTVDVEYSISISPIYSYHQGIENQGEQINTIQIQEYSIGDQFVNCHSPLSIENMSEEYGYDITVRCSDIIDSTSYGEATKSVGSGSVYLAFRSYGIGLNTVPNQDVRFAVNGISRFGNSTSYISIDQGKIISSGSTESYLNGNKNGALINSISDSGVYTALYKGNSNNGYFTLGNEEDKFILNYTSKTLVDSETNDITKKIILLDENGNSSFALADHTHGDSEHVHDNYLQALISNDYYKLATPNGDSSEWIRTTNSGLLPSSNSVGSIGNISNQFKSGYFEELYINTISIEDLLNGKSDDDHTHDEYAPISQFRIDTIVANGSSVTSASWEEGLYDFLIGEVSFESLNGRNNITFAPKACIVVASDETYYCEWDVTTTGISKRSNKTAYIRHLVGVKLT